MLKTNSGRLLVYASVSSSIPRRKRLASIQTAAEETAKLLNLDYGIVKFGNNSSQIYVYYECDDYNEPIPLYCDKGKVDSLQKICATLRKMMFVLSFHPRHSALKHVRGAITRAY